VKTSTTKKPGRKKLVPVATQVAKAQERLSRSTTDKPVDREVSNARRRKPSDFHTVAETATASDYGRPRSIEREPRLVGRERYVTFLNTIFNSDVAAIAIRALLVLVGGVRWRMDPAKGITDADGDEVSPDAISWAKACETILFEEMRTPWSMHVRRMAMHVYMGFSWLEWQARDRVDGSVGFHDLFEVSPLTVEGWDLDRNGEVHGILQRGQQFQEVKYIARAKSIYVADSAFSQGDPGGVGILRHVVKKVRQLEAMEKLEEDGYRNDLRGMKWARAPLRAMIDAGYSQEQQDLVLKDLKAWIQNQEKNNGMGVLLDSAVYTSEDDKGTPSAAKQTDIGILTGDGQGHAEIHNTINRKNQEIARPMFAVGFALGDGAGNRALAEEHARFFAGFANSVVSDIAGAGNRDLIPTLGRLNDKGEELWPKMVPDEITAEAVTTIATALMSLSTAGAPLTLDDPAVNIVRGRMHLPPVPQELAEEAKESREKEIELAEQTAQTEMEVAQAGVEQGNQKLEIDAKAQAAAAKKPAAPPPGAGGGRQPARKRKK
jgi:hypothetical protein